MWPWRKTVTAKCCLANTLAESPNVVSASDADRRVPAHDLLSCSWAPAWSHAHREFGSSSGTQSSRKNSSRSCAPSVISKPFKPAA